MKEMSTLTHDQPNAAMAPEKNMKKIPYSPAALPEPGKSRWGTFKSRCPVSKETFRKLSKAGKAPYSCIHSVWRCAETRHLRQHEDGRGQGV